MVTLSRIRPTKQTLRHWMRRADDYTRWAFNPQPPLVPHRSSDGSRDDGGRNS